MNKTKTVIVIGLGRFGESVAQTLLDLGYEVIGVDENPEVVQRFSSMLTYVVRADTTKEESLKEIGVQNCDAAVVAIGTNVEASIVTAVLLKEMNVPYIIAKASSNLHEKVLEKIGIDKIIHPEKDMGVRVAFHIISTSIVDYLHISPELCLIEIKVPEIFYGKTIDEIHFRDRYAVSVAALKRSSQMIVPPKSQEVMQKDDVLFLIGQKNQVKKLRFLL
jgi:trk system potassium uptake protein TrkA